jgi:hypothetical protein
MKDEALKLALDDLIAEYHMETSSFAKRVDEIFKQALAAQPAPVQVPVAAKDWEGAEYWMPLAWELCADECGEEACTELVWEGGPIPEPWGDRWLKYEDEAKRLIALVQKHTTPPAQPAVPDAIHHTDLSEHPQYIEGWNDCRAEMLKGMKP